MSAAPGGAGDGIPFLDGAMTYVYTGEVGLIFSGVVVVFFVYVILNGRSTGGARRPRRRSPPISRGDGRDVAALRRARMTARDPDYDEWS
ncbi:hypothetical protein P2H44_11850 [Albimonas sp. CAU 1670]|uniref:hypothetical protein n=1 Tax=Albimonas sp. CAU 1670 TaxID=3032599 RepID=UPI0023DAB6AD|nr:hypothetical protein [Albimonas sp. CAU 1670]MDF2233246.1 hypothetical protein [Albimonas sp. CAU 1670]